MGSLERVISNLPSQSPNPTQQWQSQAPTTVQATPSQPSQAQPWAYQAQAPLTSSTNASQTQPSLRVSPPRQVANPTAGLSAETQSVVRHFGVNAPAVLNQYSCKLEDMLIEQAQRFDQVNARAGAMQTILTNPDHLADYTDRFFTEVYPVDIDGQGQLPQGQPQQYQQDELLGADLFTQFRNRAARVNYTAAD